MKCWDDSFVNTDETRREVASSSTFDQRPPRYPKFQSKDRRPTSINPRLTTLTPRNLFQTLSSSTDADDPDPDPDADADPEPNGFNLLRPHHRGATRYRDENEGGWSIGVGELRKVVRGR